MNVKYEGVEIRTQRRDRENTERLCKNELCYVGRFEQQQLYSVENRVQRRSLLYTEGMSGQTGLDDQYVGDSAENRTKKRLLLYFREMLTMRKTK